MFNPSPNLTEVTVAKNSTAAEASKGQHPGNLLQPTASSPASGRRGYKIIPALSTKDSTFQFHLSSHFFFLSSQMGTLNTIKCFRTYNEEDQFFLTHRDYKMYYCFLSKVLTYQHLHYFSLLSSIYHTFQIINSKVCLQPNQRMHFPHAASRWHCSFLIHLSVVSGILFLKIS